MQKIDDYPDSTVFCLYVNKFYIGFFQKSKTPDMQEYLPSATEVREHFPNGDVYACTEQRDLNLRYAIEEALVDTMSLADTYNSQNGAVIEELRNTNYLQKCQEIINQHPTYHLAEKVLWSDDTMYVGGKHMTFFKTTPCPIYTINDCPDDAVFCIFDDSSKTNKPLLDKGESILFKKNEIKKYKKMYSNYSLYVCDAFRIFDIVNKIKEEITSPLPPMFVEQEWGAKVSKELEQAGYLEECQKIIDRHPVYHPYYQIVRKVSWD